MSLSPRIGHRSDDGPPLADHGRVSASRMYAVLIDQGRSPRLSPLDDQEKSHKNVTIAYYRNEKRPGTLAGLRSPIRWMTAVSSCPRQKPWRTQVDVSMMALALIKTSFIWQDEIKANKNVALHLTMIMSEAQTLDLKRLFSETGLKQSPPCPSMKNLKSTIFASRSDAVPFIKLDSRNAQIIGLRWRFVLLRDASCHLINNQ